MLGILCISICVEFTTLDNSGTIGGKFAVLYYEFAEEVIVEMKVIESFQGFDQKYMEDNDVELSDNFNISGQAVIIFLSMWTRNNKA